MRLGFEEDGLTLGLDEVGAREGAALGESVAGGTHTHSSTRERRHRTFPPASHVPPLVEVCDPVAPETLIVVLHPVHVLAAAAPAAVIPVQNSVVPTASPKLFVSVPAEKSAPQFDAITSPAGDVPRTGAVAEKKAPAGGTRFVTIVSPEYARNANAALHASPAPDALVAQSDDVVARVPIAPVVAPREKITIGASAA